MAHNTRRTEVIVSYIVQTGILNGERFAVEHSFTKDADRLTFAASNVIQALEAAGYRITRTPGATNPSLEEACQILGDAQDARRAAVPFEGLETE
jgi:hypothetical protein